jgi:predicted unusual protein kinase regulating ubiquinone biosynthesis (AarF/ABC1/UbiB family)
MLNGLGSRLDPETNIIEIAAPFAKRFIKAEEFTAAGIVKQAGIAARSTVRLPKLIEEFFVSTSRGETRVEITSKDIVDELRRIERVGRGFILALLAAGAGLAAVVFRISRIERESEWAGILAGVFLLWLVLLLRRKGE